MPKMSEKREKFIRLAQGRTQATLDSIRKIGNLSNRRAYEYDEADARKIVKALKDAVSDLERKLMSKGSSSDTFKL